MSNIKFKNIMKIYQGGVPAVSDLNLEIEDREFMVLVGPSGCGKSTTLRMIAGLEDITDGELFIGDDLVNHVEPKDRDIAMVFQNYALYPHMNVFDNMAFGLKLRKMPKNEIKQRVNQAADTLGITDYLKRKPKELSGGQRQRVALGRAIVRNPAVFLMDEPLSNLDAKLRVQMRTEIIKLHQELQTTFVYVTHDQTEAMTMGTRIAVMKDGVLQQVDTPHNLYERPVNKFVAEFIGSPQMNVLKASLNRAEGKVFAVLQGGQRILLSGEQTLRLKEEAFSKEIYIGIRPEHIHLAEEKEQAERAFTLRAQVEVVEQTGADLFLDAKPLGEEMNMTARLIPVQGIKVGDAVNFALDTSKLHFFDIDSEQTLLG